MRMSVLFLALGAWAGPGSAAEAELVLGEQEYFEAPGVNLLVFSNWYNGLFSDSKISGIELIHHGVRTATNGDVRLHATPEQWDPIPAFVERRVDREAGAVEAFLRYPDHDFDFSIRVSAQGAGVRIAVNLPRPLPEALQGRAGLNLEFLPAAYFERAFSMDGQGGLVPLYPAGPRESTTQAPQPLASGHRLVLAPDDPQRLVTIESADVPLAMYDGRAKAQNGWFVVRSLLPAGRSGTVLEWTLTAAATPGWLRPPVIAHSQLGYHPGQAKVAVIERDARSGPLAQARLYRVADSGGRQLALQATPQPWGRYLRYDYARFDFSEVREPGIYLLEYDGQATAPFRIAGDIYANAWQATLDVFMPVQMDHVLVNEAYRVWHGASHLDDARQAPVDHEHFDLYAQGPTTDTPFAPGEHIPGLNVGGWYDAGDYDIRTQSQYGTVLNLVQLQEHFAPAHDRTRVDQARRFVDLHVPDGRPDVLQQVEHGVLALLAQYRAVGHAIAGIVEPTLDQYTHLGDGLTKTDNLVFDPAMGEADNDGRRSGRPDDRWAFTSRSSALNYGSMAALAAASRVLQGYDDQLAKECLATALRAWEDEQGREPDLFRHGNTTGGPLETEQLRATVELLQATGEARFADALRGLLPKLEANFGLHATPLLRALPLMDEAYRQRIRQLAEAYREQAGKWRDANPFGVPITDGGWAGNGMVIGVALNQWYLHRAFPEMFGPEPVWQGLHYLYGTHPGSDVSFVSAVGAQSRQVAYGMNRADFSFIAGGIVPGALILKPDFPENKDDWPFLWGENEYVINLAASYLLLVHAAQSLLPEQEGGS